MSAAEGGKSDLKMPEDAELPRFRVVHVPETYVEKRWIDCDGEDMGLKSGHEMKIISHRDLHGHTFDVHVERAELYTRKCSGEQCTAAHPDPKIDEFLAKRDVHLMGYDNCGVFRVQVPKFCELPEATASVSKAWRLLLVERVKIWSTAKPVSKLQHVKIDGKTVTPTVESPPKDPPKPPCRHG